MVTFGIIKLMTSPYLYNIEIPPDKSARCFLGFCDDLIGINTAE
jgi:hypothetical protein